MADQAQKDQGIEYTIYAVDMAKGSSGAVGTMTDMAQAIEKAEEMIGSGAYLKVEIKQKYFDKKNGRNIDMTLKVFEAKKKFKINTAMIFVFAILCGGIAFAVTYFLTS